MSHLINPGESNVQPGFIDASVERISGLQLVTDLVVTIEVIISPSDLLQ